MKHYLPIFFCLFTFFSSNTAWAQCNQNITLQSQEDIDQFPINYPCAEIQGNLTISIDFSDINLIDNLEGLSAITSISGHLHILNQGMTDLNGLNNLTNIGGAVLIDGLNNIEDLSGLENLESIGGNVEIYENDALSNLNGLDNLTHISGGLSIRYNDDLTSFDGIESLNAVGGTLKIENNDNLTNIEGLIGLTSIGHVLDILNNDVLTGFTGLDNLANIGGDVYFHNNDLVTNVNGLGSLEIIGGGLQFSNNDGLIDFEGLNSLVIIVEDFYLNSNTALVNFNGLNNLTTIQGDLIIENNNALTNLSGLDNLSNLGGSLEIYINNALITLNGLENITSLEGYLRIQNNLSLSSLGGLQNLTSVGNYLMIFANNDLLNLEGLNNLISVGNNVAIQWNAGLLNLEGLDNLVSIGGNININTNSSLANCCTVINFLDGVNGNVNISDNLETCNSVEDIFGNCAGNYQVVEAQAFFDQNDNGSLDANEQLLYQSFSLSPSDVISYSNEQAPVYFFLEDFDNYTLSLNNSNPLWTLNEAFSEPVNIAYLDSTFTDSLHYFPMTPVATFNIQNVDLTSSITRCSQETNYWLTYTNKGTTTNNGYVELIPDELTNFVSANPPADSTAGDILYWFYEDLHPTHFKQIHLIYEMPGVNEIGEVINFEANIETNEGFGDHKAILNSELVCAYDPNDKLVTPAGVGAENYTLFGDTLEYTIRFQNTGNDTAFTVIIEDELSDYLDLNTFRPIASSHSVETQLDIDNRLATFTFNDIYLPDSFVNEPASHGFIKFEIQGKEDLGSFTAVENKADIFFDANPAIVTNTVLNTFTENIPSVFLGKVFLEGCYEVTGLMSTDLNEWLPLAQPFDKAPYNYEGTESLESIPTNMVDWVLVEARTGTPNIGGTVGTTVVERIPGILLNDGSIVNTDGINLGKNIGLRFLNLIPEQEYYFAIRHQNHLDVLTAIPLNAQLAMPFDFTTSEEQAFGVEQQKTTDIGIPVLFAGDANGDGLILNTDYDLWFLNNAVLNTYSPTDWNLDGTIQVTDYDLWFNNKAKIGIVEIQY